MSDWHIARNDGFQRYFINAKGKRQETRLYKIWDGIYQRCYNPKQKDYHNYGGRGIKLCDEWLLSTNFMRWALENGYKDSLSIDRIDVNEGYSPDNCRWVDDLTQNYNKRTTKYVIYKGERFPYGLLCIIKGIHRDTVRDRLKRGWSVEDAFDVKPGGHRSDKIHRN